MSKMIKVSCLTFHDSSNYGARLQAYALQRVVEQMLERGGDSCKYELINYTNIYKRKNDSPYLKNKDSNFFVYLYKLLEIPYNVYRCRLFTDFSDKYMHISKRMTTDAELMEYAKDKDVIIVGSDQVWNLNTIRWDSRYFLTFSQRKKTLSYAASIGCTEMTDGEIDFYKNGIANIGYLSVRENSAAKLLNKIGIKTIQVVPDPVLLLDKKQWERICAVCPKGKYIFVYIVGRRRNESAQGFIRKLKESTGLPVYGVSSGILPAVRDGVRYVLSPEQWVSFLMNAEYVVTNSFHGTAFAINFYKKFYTFLKSDAALLHDNDIRQRELISYFGLTERINPNWGYIDIKDEIPIDMINEKLKKFRTIGFEFLEKTFDEILKGVHS